METLPWWAVAVVVLSVVGRVLRGSTPLDDHNETVVSASMPDHIDQDFAKFQRRLASQSRRLDGLDAGLIALAALQFAALLFVGVDTKGETWLFKAGAAVIGLCIAFDLVAVIRYEGRESPDLHTFQRTVDDQGRPVAIRKAMEAMALDYLENAHSVAIKQLVTRWGAGITGAIVLATVGWRMVH